MVEKTTKYQIFIFIIFTYFLVELILSIRLGSIALQTDAYHMLSDLLALIIGLIATKLVKRDKSHEYTYGWVRAEIIGGLINSIFLLSICFSLLLDVGERLTELITHGAQNERLLAEIDLLLYVAGGGLLLNFIGLALFRHDHHHHDHDHGSHESTQLSPHENLNRDLESGEEDLAVAVEVIKTTADYNQQAVLLHILGDTLGSLVVIISGLVIKFANGAWKFYLDPLASLLIICFITYSSVRLARNCILILLHKSPNDIRYQELLDKITAIREVDEIHHFHVWPLTTMICKASLHVRLKLSLDQTHYLEITDRVIGEIKAILHQYGIHSSTIQPEWQDDCLEPKCKSGCKDHQCCPLDVVENRLAP